MSKRQFNHLPNLSHLFTASSDIIVSHIVKFLLVFSVYRLAFGIQHSAWRYNSELFGFSCYYLEFYGFEAASHEEKVSLFDRSVGVFEVRDKVGFGEVTLDTLDGIIKWKDVYFGEVGDITRSLDLNNISESHPEVLSNSFVHPYLSILKFVINKSYNQSFFSLFALDEDSIAFENFEFGHFGLAQLH